MAQTEYNSDKADGGVGRLSDLTIRAHTTPEPDMPPVPEHEPVPPEIPQVDPDPAEVPAHDPVPVHDPVPHQVPIHV